MSLREGGARVDGPGYRGAPMRTDHRHICLRCLRRQPERRSCAGCRHEVLADTAAAEGRAAVLARLQKEADEIQAARDAALRKQEHPSLKWEALGGGVGLVVAASQAHWAVGAALAAVFGGAYLAHTRWESRRARAGDTGAAEARSDLAFPEIRCVGEDAVPGSFTRVAGRVRCVTPTYGPLSGLPCAAARVKGTTAGGAVDDAVCGEFDLVDAGGAVAARIREGVAKVDISLKVLSVMKALPEVTRRFLDARMLLRSDERATLGEARIEDGDTVTCEGPCEAEPTGAAYRQSRAVVVYRGTSAHPVVVRRAAVRS